MKCYGGKSIKLPLQKRSGDILNTTENILTPLDVAVQFSVTPAQVPGTPQSCGGLVQSTSWHGRAGVVVRLDSPVLNHFRTIIFPHEEGSYRVSIRLTFQRSCQKYVYYTQNQKLHGTVTMHFIIPQKLDSALFSIFG